MVCKYCEPDHPLWETFSPNELKNNLCANGKTCLFDQTFRKKLELKTFVFETLDSFGIELSAKGSEGGRSDPQKLKKFTFENDT